MSVFKVSFKDQSQTGAIAADSIRLQRKIYITGPRGINRSLSEDETFQDCNYWLRFCPLDVGLSITGQPPFTARNSIGCSPDQAFLICTNFDNVRVNGTQDLWSDAPSEQVQILSTISTPMGSGITTIADFMNDYGSYVVSTCITNATAANVIIYINQNPIADLAAGASVVLNVGDYNIEIIQALGGVEGSPVVVSGGSLQIPIYS